MPIPHAKDRPPWSGPANLLTGVLYAFPAAQGAVALYFDKDQRHHCATVFDARNVGAEYVWSGRRFDIVRLEEAQ